MATATYPPPPPYYRLYKDYEQDPSSAPEPPPPVQGTYQLYGATYTVTFLLIINVHIFLNSMFFITFYDSLLLNNL